MQQIQERKARREKGKREGKRGKENKERENSPLTATSQRPTVTRRYGKNKRPYDCWKIESINGKTATVIFGDMRTKMRAERLEHAQAPKSEEPKAYMTVGRETREAIDNRKLNFKQDIDVRGMRGDEAITAVTYFIDDAILVGMSRVRILHGTGSGILRQLIRQYLATVPVVSSYHDEHVQFGGAGITVVDLE